MKKYIFVFVLALFFISGCAQNKPWRGNNSLECGNNNEKNCTLEKHRGYELGFIEFSERGNLFDVKSKDIVLNKIRAYSKENGVVVVVFVHGWKHNAKYDDKNVESFRKALADISRINPNGKKVFGVYVGWRGLSFYGLQAENTTFWDRKAVAQEVGKGGITELFLELEQIDGNKTENILAIVGHSFGGAIVLSALDEILLERLMYKKNNPKQPLNYFGDAVVLINPAIEANQVFQLQEIAREIDLKQNTSEVKKNPTKILHVISSEGDLATKFVFPIGQFLGTALTWNQAKIGRKYGDKDYNISEYDLDIITAGNFKSFHTGNIIENKNYKELNTSATNDNKIIKDDKIGKWIFKDCCICNKECNLSKNSKYHLPCTESYPISFLYTSKSFINGHNDIFNCNIVSYLLTTVSEALFYQGETVLSKCINNNDFNFTSCYREHFKKMNTTSSNCNKQ